MHLAAEAANVTAQLAAFLATLYHLTISFDGWTSKGGDEIYTINITTPARGSYLVDGLILTGLSTDGDTLFALISEVCISCLKILY